MIWPLRGIVYDFLANLGKPTETISEKEFELEVVEEDLKYKVKGFIDRLLIYEKKGIALIRDFKIEKSL